MKIFSYDSKFSQILIKISQGCYLNLLWFLCCIPVFTAGAATAALYRVTLKLARGDEPALTKQFFRGFKDNFRQATQLWLILLAIGALLGGDGYILFHLSRSTTGPAAVLWTVLFAFVIAGGIVYVIVLLYVFPLVASVENTNWAMLKNSFFIGTHYLFCTILVLAIHFAMFFVVVALFTPMIILGEGVCALLCSYLLVRVIDAVSYDPNAEAAAEVTGAAEASETAEATEAVEATEEKAADSRGEELK